MPTGQDFAIDTNTQGFFRDIVRVGNRIAAGGKWKWTAVFWRTGWPRKTNHMNGLVSSGTESLSRVDCTYAATITEKSVFPGTLTFCCCFLLLLLCVAVLFQYWEWVKSQIWIWFYAEHLVIPSIDTEEFLKPQTFLHQIKKRSGFKYSSICSVLTFPENIRYFHSSGSLAVKRQNSKHIVEKESEFLQPVASVDTYMCIHKETEGERESEWRVITKFYRHYSTVISKSVLLYALQLVSFKINRGSSNG